MIDILPVILNIIITKAHPETGPENELSVFPVSVQSPVVIVIDQVVIAVIGFFMAAIVGLAIIRLTVILFIIGPLVIVLLVVRLFIIIFLAVGLLIILLVARLLIIIFFIVCICC